MTAPFPLGPSGFPVDMGAADATFGSTGYGTSNVVSLALPSLGLADGESELVTSLEAVISSKRYRLELLDAYYHGTTRIQDLGISIPPQMRNLHTTVGWPRVLCDALDNRLTIDGFRYPDSDDIDTDLEEVWLANDLDAEHGLGNLDALVFGGGFIAVGSADAGPNVVDRPPLVTIESPLDVAVVWDARTRTTTAALRLYGPAEDRHATLYQPDQTVSLDHGVNGWAVTGRDVHRLGEVPLARLVNRSRSYDRAGRSEITPEIMSLTDAACRTLLGLAVAGEFYSAPQRYILGADESAFQDGQGNKRSGWETYLGRVLALERDQDGNMPTVGQFTAYDPSVYTKVLDSYAQRMSSLTGLPPHVLGFATANPTSADAIRSSEMELTRRADNKTVQLGKGWRDAMRLALRIRGGATADQLDRIQAVWASTATPTIAATTDAVYKQVTMGYLPAESDVTGEALGYTAAQRARIEADRQHDQGQSFLAELAKSVNAKDEKTALGLATMERTATAPAPTAAPPADGPATRRGPRRARLRRARRVAG